MRNAARSAVRREPGVLSTGPVVERAESAKDARQPGCRAREQREKAGGVGGDCVRGRVGREPGGVMGTDSVRAARRFVYPRLSASRPRSPARSRAHMPVHGGVCLPTTCPLLCHRGSLPGPHCPRPWAPSPLRPLPLPMHAHVFKEKVQGKVNTRILPIFPSSLYLQGFRQDAFVCWSHFDGAVLREQPVGSRGSRRAWARAGAGG